jgi:predicted site-specific integrase-resolvase
MEYTIREAANIRGVSTKTIRRQILAGEVKAKLTISEPLKVSIYLIPKNEIRKIRTKPSGRPRKPVQL